MPHTPGPWTVEDRRHAALKNIRVVAAGPREVCQVADVHQRDYQGGFCGSKEEHDAADAIDATGLDNARLIAAAPDMLAALKAALEDLYDVQGRKGPASMDAVLAAIAKAAPTQ